MSYLLSGKHMNMRTDYHDTRTGPVDEFADDTYITRCPITERCEAIFCRYRHFGREYIRWRLWHRHAQLGVVYPDKRRYGVIPAEHAEAFGEAILRAGRGEQDNAGPPDYIQAFDKARAAWPGDDEAEETLAALNPSV